MGSRLRPNRLQIAPGDSAQHPSPIAGIPVSTAAAAVLHAIETAQGLLQ